MGKGRYLMQKVPTYVCCSALFLVGLAGWANADGMAYDRSSLRPLYYDEQRAIISQRGGVEKMIIALNLEQAYYMQTDQGLDVGGVLWIFPVPGQPERITLDILEAFPTMMGKDVLYRAERLAWSIFALAAATQIPVSMVTAGIALPYFISYKASRPRVDKHLEVNKWGIHGEVVTADSMSSLATYLRRNKVSVVEEYLRPFQPYLSDKYVLVMAWIASFKELQKKMGSNFDPNETDRNPCLYVEFPTQRGYYPLKATSGYGEVPIKVTLYIVGHVSLDSSGLRAGGSWAGSRESADVSVRYYEASKTLALYYGRRNVWESAPKGFLQGVSEASKIDYTRVTITGAAKGLTHDLWFTNEPPVAIRIANMMEVLFVPLLIVLVAITSYVCGGLSGLVLFGRWGAYARLGLWNLLTLVAVYIAVRLHRKRRELKPSAAVFALLFTFLFHLVVLGAYFGATALFEAT